MANLDVLAAVAKTECNILTVIASVSNLCKSGGKETTESTAERSSTVEQTQSKDHLMSAVEHRQVQYHPSQETTLAKAQEEASSKQTLVALHEADAHADETPCEHQARKIIARSNILEEPIAGHVDADVGNIENGQCDVEFVAVELQVVGQAIDACIADIAPIDKGEQPKTKKPGDDVKIELASDGAVQGWVDIDGLEVARVCFLEMREAFFLGVRGGLGHGSLYFTVTRRGTTAS